MNKGRRTASRGRWRGVVITGVYLMSVCCAEVSPVRAEPVDVGLIEVDRLAVAPSAWTVLDGRPRTDWAEEHIPQARSFSWEDYTRTDPGGVQYRTFAPEELAQALGRFGITPEAPVVVYGDADASWGGEGWIAWVLAWLGHVGPIRLLHGGIQAWKDAELPLQRGDDTVSLPARYPVHLRNDLLRTVDQLNPPAPHEVLVDTRSTFEWFRGHLAGAVHLNWKHLLQGPQRRPIDAQRYRELLRENGIEDGATPVFYCTGGIRSAYAWLVHRLAGAGPAANFEGGTEAWERLKSE